MTDLKKLRKLAEMRSRDGYVYMVAECEAIIELLDRLERLENCIKKEIHRCGDWKEGREALEGGK